MGLNIKTDIISGVSHVTKSGSGRNLPFSKSGSGQILDFDWVLKML